MVFLARDPLLMLVGAEGETLGYASDFLLITLPTLALMAVGMMVGRYCAPAARRITR